MHVLCPLLKSLTVVKQAPLHGERYQTQTDVQKIPFKCKGGQVLEQVAQRGCGVSMLEDIQKLMERDPKQCAPAEFFWSKGIELDHFQKCLQTSALTVVPFIVKHLALSV